MIQYIFLILTAIFTTFSTTLFGQKNTTPLLNNIEEAGLLTSVLTDNKEAENTTNYNKANCFFAYTSTNYLLTKKILVVATNCNPIIGKEVKTGLWLSELTHFVEVVCEAGYEVVIASPLGGKIPLDENSITPKQMKDKANISFFANEKLKNSLDNSIKISDINVEDYLAIFLSGGHGTMWDFRQSIDLQKKLTEFHTANKIISGVCHGVSGFIDTKDKNGNLIIKGKRVTGFSNFEDALAGSKKFMPFLLEDEFKKNGAKFRKNFFPFTKRVEVEPNFITGQNPQSAKAVGKEVVKMLQK